MFDYKTRTLEKLRIGITQRLSLLDVIVDTDYVADQIEVQIRGYIWQEKLDHVEISYPLDWWQAFKERWLPAWILKHSPVIKQTHIFDMAVLYPDYIPVIEPYIMALHHCEIMSKID